MTKQVFINFPVRDLEKSKAFYEALGFVNDPNFSDSKAAGMQWSEHIIFMLVTHDFYKEFLKDKTIADTLTTSSSLVALSMDSREAVQKFADTAKENGGDYFIAGPNKDLDFMFGYEVTDLDGNTIEPVWMDPNFDPSAGEHLDD